MRSLFNLFALALVVVGEKPTLEQVYGSVEEVKSMLPVWKREESRSRSSGSDLQALVSEFKPPFFKSLKPPHFKPPHFKAMRTPDNCTFPIDLLLLQDATASFEDDYVNMATTQLALLKANLLPAHPGSRVGVATFRDKPIWSLGEPKTDYCQKFNLPLTENITAVTSLYETLVSTGGGDAPENQFGALVAASQSETPGWGKNPYAASLVVVVTDGAPHFEGDGFNNYGLSNFTGTFDEANMDSQCIKEYYPTPATVRTALESRGLYAGFLVYDGDYDYNLTRKSWQWTNAYLEQLPGFFHDMEEKSSNFWEDLSHIISTLENVECHSDVPTPNPSCGVCPNPCPPEGCDPCCKDGVLIKLRHRPSRLHLEIENDEI